VWTQRIGEQTVLLSFAIIFAPYMGDKKKGGAYGKLYFNSRYLYNDRYHRNSGVYGELARGKD